MIDERELWACANLLIEQHGETARQVAMERAEALRTSGQPEGHSTFLRIAERIGQLQSITSERPTQ